MLKKYCTTLLLTAVFAATQVYADATKAAIASAHPLATAAGFEILARGGNVFDAAVAVSATLAVVEPSGSGLGGGGYWLLHREADGFETMIDGREKAPLAAHHAMYLDKTGTVIPRLSLDGALAAAIPGLPAGLVHLSEKYGRLPLADSLQPAIRAAKNGFAIGEKYRKLLKFRAEVIKQHPPTAQIFLADGEIPKAYAILRQTDLANTLEHLADSGKNGFYTGKIADKLVSGVNKAGGIWTKQDLADYRIVERTPVTGHYRGINITSAAPSSSGGIVLIQALNILSGYDLTQVDELTRKHLIVEAMRRAYHDRSLYLGDPDFVDIPVRRLLNEDYAAGLRSSLRLDKALPSEQLAGQNQPQPEGVNTTHFSIIDEQGNRVAATLSINFPFGAGLVAAGTGVLLNNEMDDFASLPGAMNGYGLVGGVANAIAPGKRMLSSMTPTFLDDGQHVAVLGTPGGSRIISMVLLAALDFAQGNAPDSWVKVPRFHHQFMPDVVEYEHDAVSSDELSGLAAMGHQLKPARYSYGDMQAVQWHKTTHQLTAASDRRGEGQALVSR
ncbi:MAG: gamma-glutamyltransferase [Methylobacter sp.]|nr:gamma-glutamyltransferase [Methylobacter sp.]MDP2097348.1 gamma-glutamyltransferase [Methylobacter sp.]MDP2429282.1 gamma-glutamyltransferase [Methylobacter sp.]MDP3054195.1 gamma-glutamyltransferase [Methylobacter sp.]MDP3363046.1 gamma-glutamyltransferase [Methylobacter sp.]